VTEFNIHLVSDATGETLQLVARAAVTQFEAAEPTEHLWSMIRTEDQLQAAIDGMQDHPGLVMYTLVNKALRQRLEASCRQAGLPSVDILRPAIDMLRHFLHAESRNQPGRQHVLDADYFARIDAMTYTLAHDDGQSLHGLKDADVVLVGVSRTSKTPTSMYLANRGVKTANVPLIAGQAIPDELEALSGAAVVGLTTGTKRLIEVRRSRLMLYKEGRDTDYVDEEAVRKEVADARRLFTRKGWPVIDVTGRSIEETAAGILRLLAARAEQ
jgi:regulator of PEP synthase PpsR (kinase-PPPase family)